jgi:hypothetical protein
LYRIIVCHLHHSYILFLVRVMQLVSVHLPRSEGVCNPRLRRGDAWACYFSVSPQKFFMKPICCWHGRETGQSFFARWGRSPDLALLGYYKDTYLDLLCVNPTSGRVTNPARALSLNAYDSSPALPAIAPSPVKVQTVRGDLGPSWEPISLPPENTLWLKSRRSSRPGGRRTWLTNLTMASLPIQTFEV